MEMETVDAGGTTPESTSRVQAGDAIIEEKGNWAQRLKLAEVRDEVRLLLRGQVRAEYEIEELDGVLQGQQAFIVQIRAGCP
jgi:hypothetical protein